MRIGAPLLFSQIAMGRLAADVAARYPEVRLEVTTEDRPVDMVEEGYDLVIRVNPDPAALVGRVILRAARSWSRRRGLRARKEAGPRRPSFGSPSNRH